MLFCIDYINKIVYSSSPKAKSTILGVVFISAPREKAVGPGPGIVHLSENAYNMLKRHDIVNKEDLVKVFEKLTKDVLCDHKKFMKVMSAFRQKGIIFREYLKNKSTPPTLVPQKITPPTLVPPVQYDLSIFYEKEKIIPQFPVPFISDEVMERDLYNFDESASKYYTANIGEFDLDQYLENMDKY